MSSFTSFDCHAENVNNKKKDVKDWGNFVTILKHVSIKSSSFTELQVTKLRVNLRSPDELFLVS